MTGHIRVSKNGIESRVSVYVPDKRVSDNFMDLAVESAVEEIVEMHRKAGYEIVTEEK